MSNPLYKSLGQPRLSGPFGNIQQMIQQFNQFKQSFNGNPQQQVQQLLNSGKMSQEQFNQLKQLADQFQGMLK